MLLLVLATEAEQPAWWDEVARWTYQSCRAFLEHLTEPHASKVASNGQPQRMLKLGSCWGGWDCSNPSYHAPGHWRAFRCAAAARTQPGPTLTDAPADAWQGLHAALCHRLRRGGDGGHGACAQVGQPDRDLAQLTL